ncbi:hypothetical protein AVBRAN12640_09300 [Campylobacter sp. RM12640]|uniref:hypothetical protein n=1 Tax=unclassified Campylobacter TaxID=2593542 RepID=UPI001BDA3219|nr:MULTISPECIES: hypothetical protein [unclassified Campylobacter]MBZ7980743.1 hypothetical protein [Campylobacter sp. RM12642]MBZ7982730.1 hypothetical protein [Campylobacter sp. RM12640]MBZ7989979.1 hypothetical protein [Campylobacter sp. RM12635]MBZ7991978.1 hypothetical protein [Campylobacter sp. RM9331]MBZ7993836.1 hypothetical protein [Campylobacter sp. RM9333]MBZ8006453.1 hypothetical protein [Campylobacter sp. RM9332]MBZ8008432.1 hypothetical protein [Campylobacter sp. RM9334]
MKEFNFDNAVKNPYIDKNLKTQEYQEERRLVSQTMAKMEKELDKPEILSVFKRLKDK